MLIKEITSKYVVNVFIQPHKQYHLAATCSVFIISDLPFPEKQIVTDYYTKDAIASN